MRDHGGHPRFAFSPTHSPGRWRVFKGQDLVRVEGPWSTMNDPATCPMPTIHDPMSRRFTIQPATPEPAISARNQRVPESRSRQKCSNSVDTSSGDSSAAENAPPARFVHGSVGMRSYALDWVWIQKAGRVLGEGSRVQSNQES